MGQNPSESGPIAEESASLKHIGYALDLVSKLLDMMGFPEDYENIETVMSDDLVNLQHHLVNAKYASPSHPNPTVESVTAILEDLYAVKIDEDDGSCEGEMRAEAEAERRADAALELSAELASCDWGAWE